MALPIDTRVTERRRTVEEYCLEQSLLESCQRLKSYCGEQRLLPRIDDYITLNLIAPKLSWGVCRRLASLNRGWRHAFRSGAVHHARVQSHSTETLLLLSYTPTKHSRILTLLSVKENRCYKLPPFPYLDGRIPATFKCIPLDGKIYVLGGEFLTDDPEEVSYSNGVYLLDIARGSQWKRCAQMIETRADFGCGVFNGKIYVFGGLGRTAVCESEVYDPENDTWSPIKAMTSLRFDHRVETVGAELIVHGGKAVDRTFRAWEGWTRYHSRKNSIISEPMVLADSLFDFKREAASSIRAVRRGARTMTSNSLEIYNVDNDEWTPREGPRSLPGVTFMANGKFHSLSAKEIHVHDSETNSWTRLHSHSFIATGLVNSELVFGKTAVVVDDRLLAIVEGTDRVGKKRVHKACLLQSKGLGSSNETITWERTPFTYCFEATDIGFTNYSMHLIQL